jgi:predicted permease
MRLWRTLAVHVRALVRRCAADADLDEEIRSHVERDIERRMAQGMSAADARDAASRSFGNVTVLTEEARAASRVDWMEQLGQDARYALRGFRRSPRFVLTVVLTIGLGLGLVTSAFTIFDAYVLRLLEVHDPQSLFEMHVGDPSGGSRAVTWAEYATFARSNPAFSETFASHWVVARRDGEPVMIEVVTGNYFRMLGIRPTLGRTLEPEDAAEQGSAPVLVLSHRAWTAKFGSDSAVIGTRLRLRDRTFEIVGVAREGFDGLGETPPDAWAPITMAAALEDGVTTTAGPFVHIVGRLVPGMSEASATRALTAWAREATTDRPKNERVSTVVLESKATPIHMSPSTMVAISPIFVAFALVLLIACANVANMLLARGMARQREIGIRLALGAARARLVRQLMTEALLLAVPAGAFGFLLSRIALSASVGVMFATVPDAFMSYIRVRSLEPDVRLFVFLLVGALIAAVTFGLAPALQTTRASVLSATRGEILAAGRPARLRNLLVIGQVMSCALLAITAGVLLRGARRLETLDTGLRSERIAQVYAPSALRSRVIERLGREPGVVAIEGASQAPFDGRFPQVALTSQATGFGTTAGRSRVTPGYYRALGIPLVRGRTFTPDEARTNAPVALVSQSTARALWPNADPIGQAMSIAPRSGTPRAEARTVRVIGLVGDVVAGFIGEGRDHPTIYEPASADQLPTLVLPTRWTGERSRIAVRRALEGIDPSGSIEIHTLDESIEVQVYPFRAAHWVATALGVVALVLTISGIYGVLAYVVALREKEIGIRVALGATRRAIVGLVVRQSVRLAGIGVVVGAVLASGVSRLIASRLAMLPAFDPVALVVGSSVVLLAALAAAFVPSRRAASVDPVQVLK